MIMTKKGHIALLGILLSGTYLYAGGEKSPTAIIAVEPTSAPNKKVPVYLGLGLTAAGVKSSLPNTGEESLKDTTLGGIVRVGWNFNDHIGIEFRGLKTRLSKDFSEVSHVGLYIKPQIYLKDEVNLYGLAGYGITKINFDDVTSAKNISTGSFSYGAGMAYSFAKNIKQKPKSINANIETHMGKSGWVMDNALLEDEKENTIVHEYTGRKGWGLWIDFQHILNDEGALDTNLNILSTGILYDF